MRIDIDSCEEILITITRNKTRSLLTAFGVFWGIFIKVSGKDVGGIWNSLILSACAMGWRKLISSLLPSPTGEERLCMEIRNMNVA